MIDVYERNMDYLCGMELSSCEIEEITANIIFNEFMLYDFKDLMFEEDITDYEISEIIYHKESKQFVNVYVFDADYYDAFVFQAYNIPGRNYTDVGACIMISKAFCALNNVVYKAVLGHELAHLDHEAKQFKKFDDSQLQMRYSLIEVYCDIKGFELLCNTQEIEENLSDIIDTICPNYRTLDTFFDSPKIREIELRKTFMRLYIKGKINSETIANYIDKNYLKHMYFINKNAAYYDYLAYEKYNDKSKWSKTARVRFMDYSYKVVNKYFI